MNRYTTIQAGEKRGGIPVLMMIFSPFFKFFKMYIIKAGFLDGLQGFVLSVYSGFSEFVKSAKMAELASAPEAGAILLRAPNWIGDAVMMTMVLREAKRLYKKVFVAVSGAGVKAVLEGSPHIDRIIQYDRKSLISTLAAAWELRKEKIGAGISFSPSLSSYLFLFFSAIKTKAGYADDMGGLFLNRVYKRDTGHKREHVTEEYKKLMYLVNNGFDFSAAKQELYPAGGAGKKSGGRRILMAPFAKFGPSKMWPVKNYIELIKLLLDKYRSLAISITGLKEDDSFILPKEITGNKRFKDLRGAALGDVMLEAKGASLFIGNDSGIMHIADAFGTPMIVIYGSTAPYWGGPITSKAAQLYEGLDCQPCFEKQCRYGHYNCLKKITPGAVLDKASAILG
jgi:lipopolysaccharide heptosyltransferase II